MTRIFLVEDEVYALKVLEQKINDLEGGFEIVGAAANGTEALAKIEAAKPSILMTDIRMPDMDGIALIEELVKRGHTDILPVIISGYQEFEYAKQAVRLGVQDYLLKPVDLQELRSCLDACVAQLQRRGKKDNVVSFLVGEESISFTMIPDKYAYVVAYIIAGNALGSYENIIHPNIPYTPSAKVEALVPAAFPTAVEWHCFDGFFSNEKVLILGAEPTDKSSFFEQFCQIAKQLEAVMGSYITLQFCEVEGEGTVASSIRACRRGAVQKLAFGETRVSGEAAAEPVHKKDGQLKEHVELLQMLIRQGDTGLLQTNVARIFNAWEEEGHSSAAVQENMVLLLSLLSGRFQDRDNASASAAFYVENLLCFSSSKQEIEDGFAQLLLVLFGKGKADTKGVPSEELVKRIETYFENNLHTNLSLQVLTEELGISKVYLCRIFKKHKNTTPMDYFTNMKIQKARGLLRQFPDMPLREVADQLGFADIYYFSKVYKRITGISPSEDRA